MAGEMLAFDFREGGSYRMRLRYAERDRGRGKTTVDADVVTVRLVRLVPGRLVRQEVVFDSADASFAGRMRMAWTLEPSGIGTLVTVTAEDVPEGIDAVVHVAALDASLERLAVTVETLT